MHLDVGVLPQRREYTPQERAMLVAWALCKGEALTVRDVCVLTGLLPRAARGLLSKVVRVLPVFKDGPAWRSL